MKRATYLLFDHLIFSYFLLSVLLDVSGILDLITESIIGIDSIEKVMEGFESVKEIGESEMMNENTNENLMAVIDLTENRTEIDKNTNIVKKEIMPVMTCKQLNSLTNSISTIYANNTDSILSKEILSKLTMFNTEIINWKEKTQLSLPQQSTRSKTSKDVKTTTVHDLQEVCTSLVDQREMIE